MTDIKPASSGLESCPFCGGVAELYFPIQGKSSRCRCANPQCQDRRVFFRVDEVREAWNTRIADKYSVTETINRLIKLAEKEKQECSYYSDNEGRMFQSGRITAYRSVLGLLEDEE